MNSSLPDNPVTNSPLVGDENLPEQWGFVVYRTTYSDQARWDEMKAKLQSIVFDARNFIQEEGGDPDGATLKYVESVNDLAGKTAKEIRL